MPIQIFPLSMLFMLLKHWYYGERKEERMFWLYHNNLIHAANFKYRIQLQTHSRIASIKISKPDRQWWCMPLIPALGREKQVDLCEFEASLVYRTSSRTGSKATEKPCLEKQEKKLANQTTLCHILLHLICCFIIIDERM